MRALICPKCITGCFCLKFQAHQSIPRWCSENTGFLYTRISLKKVPAGGSTTYFFFYVTSPDSHLTYRYCSVLFAITSGPSKKALVFTSHCVLLHRRCSSAYRRENSSNTTITDAILFYSSSTLQAEADVLSHRASLALNLTAPVKPTQTVFLMFQCVVCKSFTTAQAVTASRPRLCAVTHTTLCAFCTGPLIGLTEIRWLSWIDEDVCIQRRGIRIDGDKRFPIIPTHHANGRMEALHEIVTDLTEERHLPPAAAKCAGTRKAMTFTLRSHLYPYGLYTHMTRQKSDKWDNNMLSFFICAFHPVS